MAVLTATSVTIIRAWSEGGTHGKDLSCRLVSIATNNDGSGNGSVTNAIPAAAVSLGTIEQAGPFVISSSNKLVPASPDSTGAYLLLYNITNATDANRNDPADYINTTIRGVVKGYL